MYDLKSTIGIEVMRYSTAHILAQAIKRLYDDVNLGIGPVITKYGVDTSTEMKLSITKKGHNPFQSGYNLYNY